MDSSMIASELAAIRAENKQIIKMLRKLKAGQDDPDGSKAKERASKNGFSKPQDVTDTLRAFLGLGPGEQISRSNVTKRISAYVKDNGLKHPDNGRVIVLDDKLTTLLNPTAGEQITFLNIQKYLSPHYIKAPGAPEKAPKKEKAPEIKEEPSSSTAPVKRPVVKKKPTVVV